MSNVINFPTSLIEPISDELVRRAMTGEEHIDESVVERVIAGAARVLLYRRGATDSEAASLCDIIYNVLSAIEEEEAE